ncbi:MAG: hypothetical protein RMY29_018650 [Nostoc sp. CreGUA01]|nr:hypothetical protein [Nostoc sp. CreGUA01]
MSKELQFLAGHRFRVKLTPMNIVVPLPVSLSEKGCREMKLNKSGDNIQILIFPNGEWKFINET